MSTSLFFRLFPPPKYMAMRHAGLEISDDAIRVIQYVPSVHGQVLGTFDEVNMPEGIVEGGDVKDEQELEFMLRSFVQKNNLTYVSVSVPEEKAYLFQTDVTGTNIKDIAQNIEFKLEENVPLSAKDAIFYFDLMPLEVTGGILRASVSVVPRTYIEKQIDLMKRVGLVPFAFEIAPKSIARAVVGNNSNKTSLIVHIMNRKTGIYIISGKVVCFTSTIAWGRSSGAASTDDISVLSQEIDHTFAYWSSKAGMNIDEIILTGGQAPEYRDRIASSMPSEGRPVCVANTWQNVFDLDIYIPPLTRTASLDYAVVAGLAEES